MNVLRRQYQSSGAGHWLGWTLVLVVTSVVDIQVPLPLSRSGTLQITLADVVASLAWLVLLGMLASRRWRPRPAARALLWAVLTFSVWFVVMTALHYVRGAEVLQPFLVVRSTLLPLAALLLLDAGLETPRRALGGLAVFVLGLNLWHLGDWNNMRMSGFLGNSIVYGGLLAILLPVSAYIACRPGALFPTPLRWIARINIFAAVLFPVWTGSRGPAAVAVVVAIGCFVIFIRDRRAAVTLLGLGVGAVVVTAAFWLFNPQGSAYGIYRLVPPPGEFGLSTMSSQTSSNLAQRQTAVSQMVASDGVRSELRAISLDHVQAHPVVGDGLVYFDPPDDGSPQQYAAHNIVLEHLNAYGGVGFLLYVLIVVVALWPVLLLLRTRGAPRKAAALTTLSTMAFVAISLTQPTSLIMAVVVPFFAAAGALLDAERRIDGADARPGARVA